MPFGLPDPAEIVGSAVSAAISALPSVDSITSMLGLDAGDTKPVVITPRIDPMPQRLGDFLSDTAEAGELGFKQPDVIAHESSAASAAFNPGFPTSDPSTYMPRDLKESIRPTDGLHDLSAPARKALAQYATENQNAVNRYASDNAAIVETTGLSRGHALPKTQDSKAFAPSPAEYFDDISGGTSANATLGSFFGSERLKGILSKDGTIAPDPTAGGPLVNDILLSKGITHDAEGNLVETNLTRGVEEVLNETNRYSPTEGESPYIKNKTTDNELDAYSHGLWSVQTGTGILGEYDKDAPKVTVEDLRVMALQVMVNASGHKTLADANMLDFGAIADLAALIPSVTQIGAGRVDASILRIKNSERARHGGDILAQGGEAGLMAAADALGLPKDVVPDLGASRLYQSKGADDIILVQRGDEIFGIGASGKVSGLSAPINAASYGGMNSFVEPFDGPMPMGMLLITLYGVLGTALIGGIMEGALASAAPNNAGKTNGTNPPTPQNPRSMSMGRRVPAGDSLAQMFLELFGIYRTEGNWAACVVRGTMAFYGFPGPPQQIKWQDAIGVALNIALAPGYYATITKQVLRDIEQITDAAMDFGNSMGVTGVITSIFKLIESLFSSTTFKFINTLAQMGDKVYQATYTYGQIAHKGGNIVKYEDEPLSKILNPYTRMNSQSRFQVGSAGAKSWVGKYNLWTYGSLLLPNKITDRSIAGLQTVTPFDKTAKSGDEGYDKRITADNLGSKIPHAKWLSKNAEAPKIDEKTVELVEGALDTEYIPFYIQDLRTNEIIAMPAFIQSIGDSFSADYSDTHGYGRTDPVKTYNKTTRSVDVTFRLAAMSPNDHEYMWYVINRLVALLYPQRSKGRSRLFEQNTKSFIQPFSQVPTASPMVRLRLGDLLASNYSTKNLGRLFGYPSNFDMTLSDKDLTKLRSQAMKNVAEEGKAIYIARARADFSKELLEGTYKGKVRIKKGTDIEIEKGGVPGAERTHWEQPSVTADWMEITLLEYDESHAQYVADQRKTEAAGAEGALPPDAWGIGFKWSADMATAIPGNPKYPVSSGLSNGCHKIYRCRGANQKKAKFEGVAFPILGKIEESAEGHDARVKKFKDAYIKDQEKAFNTKMESQKGDNKTKYEEFMAATSNAFVRSFNSSRGRGLAGFITQMGLNYDGAMWETKAGSRVPTMVEIQMSFAPIHDLPLGLDHNGQIIAPSHPAGAAHTNPYASAKGAPPDQTQTPYGIEHTVAGQNVVPEVETPDPVNEDAAAAAPSTPGVPGMSLGGFDPMKLMGMMGSMSKLKDLF